MDSLLHNMPNMPTNMSNVSTADIVVLNPYFQDFIQFFILLFAVSSILIAYGSIVFPHWMDETKKYYIMIPTMGSLIPYSLFIMSICLVVSCVSILVLFDNSDGTYALVSIACEVLWACLAVAVILLMGDVMRIVWYLIPRSNRS